MTAIPNLHPAAAASLAKWHAMVAANDLSGLRPIVHPEATFRSPVAHTAYKSADALILAVSTAATVFSEFTYYRQAATADGLSVVLEFGAQVAGKDVQGHRLHPLRRGWQNRRIRGDDPAFERFAGPGRGDGQACGRHAARVQGKPLIPNPLECLTDRHPGKRFSVYPGSSRTPGAFAIPCPRGSISCRGAHGMTATGGEALKRIRYDHPFVSPVHAAARRDAARTRDRKKPWRP